MTSVVPDIGAALRPLLATEAFGEGIVACYLFGSRADGRAHRESDVDVGILIDRARFGTERARFDERVRLTGTLAAALGVANIDLVLLNDAPAGLAAHIATRGTLLYCADAEAEHAFRRDAQLRAADLQPFLRRARQIKLQVIAR
jgi:predicted nucleotidyltransferase